MNTSIVLRSYFHLILCITMILHSYACEEFLLDLPNQSPEVQTATDTYCMRDQLIRFSLVLSDYEETPLDIELIVDNQVLDLSSAYSFSQGLTSDQNGMIHHFAWQKACDTSSFDFDSYELSSDSKKYLSIISQWLGNNNFKEIQISGHADNVGSDEYNFNLSKARAEAVVKFILSIDPTVKNIYYKGFGNSVPIRPNYDGPENRRIEFKINN